MLQHDNRVDVTLRCYAKYSIMHHVKPIIWVGNSKEDLMAFPAMARREAGFQLDKVQHGHDPDNWKPMHTIGPGVREIRIGIQRARSA